jgi:hypothetical protein
MAVLCIAGCTFIAYPMALATLLVTWEDQSFELKYHVLSAGIWRVLVYINCSINVIFYLSFSSK